MIIPTVFSHSKREFDARLERLLPIANNFQIDLMDGKFVPAVSVALAELPALAQYGKQFEAHLMVEHPLEWIEGLKEKGFSKVIFHIEAKDDAETVIAAIRAAGMRPGLALNPETPLSRLDPYLQRVELILFMGISPGREGQSLRPAVCARIKALREKDPIPIQVDGGINAETIAILAAAGADHFNSGSFISESEDPRAALEQLELGVTL